MSTPAVFSLAAVAGATTGVGVVLMCFSLGILIVYAPAVAVGALAGAVASTALVGFRRRNAQRN